MDRYLFHRLHQDHSAGPADFLLLHPARLHRLSRQTFPMPSSGRPAIIFYPESVVLSLTIRAVGGCCPVEVSARNCLPNLSVDPWAVLKSSTLSSSKRHGTFEGLCLATLLR